jgi:hypothetical protein
MHWASTLGILLGLKLCICNAAPSKYHPPAPPEPQYPEFHIDQVCIERHEFDRLVKNYQGLTDAVQNERDSRLDKYPVRVRFPLLKSLFKKDFAWQDWYERDYGSLPGTKPPQPVTVVIGDGVQEGRLATIRKPPKNRMKEKVVAYHQ